MPGGTTTVAFIVGDAVLLVAGAASVVLVVTTSVRWGAAGVSGFLLVFAWLLLAAAREDHGGVRALPRAQIPPRTRLAGWLG